MPLHRHHCRLFASALALAMLITAGAACSSSSKSAGGPASGSTGIGAPTTTGAKVAGTGEVSAPSRGTNPCTLVSDDEVKAILGTTATASGPTNANRGANCKWNLGTGASLLVQVYTGKTFYDPAVQAPKATKLAGIGDDAYLDASGTTRVDVGFLKGNTAVFIDGFQVASADALTAAAKDAASKL
jgi:hypothetical protein